MTACDHHAWLQASGASEVTIHDTGRLGRLLEELDDVVEQKPSLWFFVGKKAKEEAMKLLFPWNNLKKGRRNAIVTLRVETSRMQSNRPILFAESDPFADLSCEPEASMLCHESASHRLEWSKSLTKEVFDALHARLFFLFVDVLCVFADDFNSFDHVIESLKSWASFGRACLQFADVKPTVLIVKSASHSSPSVTFEVLERMDDEFALLQKELMKFFGSIVMVNLVNSELSPPARHRPLRDLLRREGDSMQHLREVRGCLFSAAHLNHFYTAALAHTARSITTPFDFVVANCLEPPRTRDTDQRLQDFLALSRENHLPQSTIMAFVASALLLAAYPQGSHGKRDHIGVAIK